MKVEIQEEWFSIDQCKANPSKLYIFGDNTIFKGKAGQAIIRDEMNAFGIPTKRLPSNNIDAFMRDEPKDYEYMNIELQNLKQILETDLYSTIVFPKNGIGTGLARMPETSPKLFKELCSKLKNKFGIEMTPKGFVK